MKTLYLTYNGAMCIDPEENFVDRVQNEREGISRIYLAKEPMHVVYGEGEYKREIDVKKDDIIITFYSNDWKERIVVAKSKDWVNNLKEWNKEEQRRKEEWAYKQANPDSDCKTQCPSGEPCEESCYC